MVGGFLLLNRFVGRELGLLHAMLWLEAELRNDFSKYGFLRRQIIWGVAVYPRNEEQSQSRFPSSFILDFDGFYVAGFPFHLYYLQ